jgi:hypothetical protein
MSDAMTLPDALTVLRRGRTVGNQTINLYRGRAALHVLMDQLNGEQCAYRMTALAYAESPGRDVRNEIARAAEEVAATLVRVVNQLDAILARTENEPWD